MAVLMITYSGTSNNGHFRAPSLVAVVLEVAVVGRFDYMYIFYQKKNWPEEVGGAIKCMSHQIELTWITVFM